MPRSYLRSPRDHEVQHCLAHARYYVALSDDIAMPTDNRFVGRDVHLYDAKDRETILGGLELNSGVTNANFYSMVEIFISFESDYVLLDEATVQVPRNGDPLQTGCYFIMTEGMYPQPSCLGKPKLIPVQGSITITDETPLFRTISVNSGTRVRGFRDSVRDRDRRCLISGDVAQDRRGNWHGCNACHVFPLAHEGHWNEYDYGRWISIPPPQGGLINSVQNGLLLRSDLHQLFDGYDISINPDVCIWTL